VRAGLSAQQVLDVALNLALEEGLESLTMRRIASELGVAPNSLYSHFADKAALIDAVLDATLAEIDAATALGMAPRVGLRYLMLESRRMLLGQPGLMPALLSRPMRGPNASRLAEVALQLLAGMGVEGPAAVDALRILLTYTLGSAALDAPRQAEPDPSSRWETSELAFGSREDMPLVSRHARELARPPAEGAFDRGLEWLLDGIATQRRRSRQRR
jgi:AcrR family transcriptional regulator